MTGNSPLGSGQARDSGESAQPRLACGHSHDELVLLHADALDADDADRANERVVSCDTCRTALDELIALTDAVTTREGHRFDGRRAADARAVALDRIRRGSIRAILFRAWNYRPVAWTLRLGFATAFLVAGVLIGRSGTSGLNATIASDTGADPSGLVLDVRDISIDQETGIFTLEGAEYRDAAVQGSADDPAVRLALARAVQYGDDMRIRLHALRAVQAIAGSASEPDPAISAAIVSLLKTDSGDAVRLRAVQAIDALYAGRSLPDDVRGTLLDLMTSDHGDAVRIATLDALVARELQAQDAERLLPVARQDPNPYIRRNAAGAMGLIEPSVPLEDR